MKCKYSKWNFFFISSSYFVRSINRHHQVQCEIENISERKRGSLINYLFLCELFSFVLNQKCFDVVTLTLRGTQTVWRNFDVCVVVFSMNQNQTNNLIFYFLMSRLAVIALLIVKNLFLSFIFHNAAILV